ncbi:MAG: leucyl/phenylalanyl-tRNA--protein transferase [Alphaproteobacteria bacterium]|nr:leucyl/phenylalanyl-tRNA--protein transferase [Alphaproteobacteria bacterium]
MAITTSIGWKISSVGPHDERGDRSRGGLRLTPEILLAAYAAGIFPMGESADDPELFWVDPRRRGILPLDTFHVPSRLRRVVRQGSFEIRCDSAFEEVIRGCAEATEKRPNTWINDEIVRLYAGLFARGAAHSVEAWRAGILVGGLYGVAIGAAFFGESMFSRAGDASKVALVHLAARLRLGGYRLLDTQFLTPHLAQFGGIEITRAHYHRLLGEALSGRASFPAALPDVVRGDPLAALQSSKTTS